MIAVKHKQQKLYYVDMFLQTRLQSFHSITTQANK